MLMKEIIKMNTPEQNEFLVRWCLEHNEREKLQNLLENGAQLSAFMLTCMVFFGYKDDEIKETVLRAENVSQNAFVWLKERFKLSEITGILEKFSRLSSETFSDEELVELKLWSVLAAKHRWDTIAQNAPEFLESQTSNTYAMRALLKADFDKYAETALKQGMYYEISSVKGGFKYLLDHGQKDYVFKSIKSTYVDFKSDSVDQNMSEVCNLIKENGLIDELYQNEAYDFLLKNKIFDPFVKNHSYYWKFLYYFPEHVDWEGLWMFYHSDKYIREHLVREAKNHKYIPACKNFVSRHTGLSGFLNR